MPEKRDVRDRYPEGFQTTVDNPHPRGIITQVTAFLPQEQLLEIAQNFHTTDAVRAEVGRRLRAYMGVLTSRPDQMQASLQAAASEGIQFADPRLFPLAAGNTAIFQDAGELCEHTGELATELVAQKIADVQQQLEDSGSDASKLIREITLIAQARVSGVQPGEILTPDRLRMCLATELAGRQVFRQMHIARSNVKGLLNRLPGATGNGISGQSLQSGSEELGDICRGLSSSLREIQIMSSLVSKEDNDTISPVSEDAMAMIARGQEIFEPFIQGPNLVTMSQLQALETYLDEMGIYNEGLAKILRRGYESIQANAGNHEIIAQIERQLAVEERVSKFERIVKAVDANMGNRAIVLAYAAEQNRMVLRNVPREMLREAASNSDIPAGYVEGLELGEVIPEGLIPGEITAMHRLPESAE